MTKEESIIEIQKQNGFCNCINCSECVFHTCYDIDGTNRTCFYVYMRNKNNMKQEALESTRLFKMNMLNYLKLQLLLELSE